MPTLKKRQEALYFLDAISAHFPNAKIELDYDVKDPWQLLVAVVLSAQSTDVGVNRVTPALFKRFPNVKAFAKAEPEDVEPLIQSLGFFRNKAKSLVGAAQKIVADFGGKLPRSREDLESIPGVGPKSAAVIIANVFGEPAIAVDTHVGRIARRLGLTKHEDPNKVETDLTALLPKERLLEAHHAIIWHGRRICNARKPLCSQCPVEARCPKVGVKASG
jgi:endonuclease-3